MQLIGALFGSVAMFTIPGMMQLAVFGKERNKTTNVLSYGMIGLGLLMSLNALAISLLKLLD